jgi:hypothetical protein
MAGCRVDVEALSPSDVSFKLAQASIAEHLSELEADRVGRRLIARSPNEASIALWLAVGQYNLLLGSDLEEQSDPRDGWQVIVSEHGAKSRLPAQLIKVPHHGSKNADNASVWGTMLTSDACAILTPFRRQKLPRPEDLQRLVARSRPLYITADPAGRRLPRRAPAVERTMREVTTSRRLLRSGSAGHVRFRVPVGGGAPKVSLFDGAYRVG